MHVYGPQLFRGRAPQLLESIYKIDTGSDHAAKFRGDRPKELGDLAAKKKKNITSKIEDLPLLRTGGLINICNNDDRRLIQTTMTGTVYHVLRKDLTY